MTKNANMDLQKYSRPELQQLIEQATLAKRQVHRAAIAQAKADIVQLLAERGLSFEEVFKAAPASAVRGTSTVKPKYANPADSAQTWSGRGKRPHWVRDAIDAGRTLESLAIKG